MAKGHFHFGVFHRQANQSCIRIGWLGVSIVLVVNFLSHASVKFSQFVGIRFLMHLKSSTYIEYNKVYAVIAVKYNIHSTRTSYTFHIPRYLDLKVHT